MRLKTSVQVFGCFDSSVSGMNRLQVPYLSEDEGFNGQIS